MTAAPRSLHGARVLVGVGGGIAAYKIAHLVRGLVAEGADVRVVPTASSLEFVGTATWEALSHHPVLTSVFEDVDKVAHVRRGQEADLVVIAPATADLLARQRLGRADDLLTASLLVTRAPVVVAPAMHTEMWEHPATVENVQVLRERGITILEPAVGRLTGPDSGAGRLPEPEAILDAARAAIRAPRAEDGLVRRDLAGRTLLISAGGTREDLDPVRFLANHSSGRQGWALAHAALVRGARVQLAAANVDLDTPPGAERLDVGDAAELAEVIAAHSSAADALVMAAAVADFTAAQRSDAKIKKTQNGGEDDSVPHIELRRTQDILRRSVVSRGDNARPVIVGFAAETGEDGSSALELARAKARRKGADLLVFNDVSAGVFGSTDNAVHVLDRDGEHLADSEGSKTEVAHAVIDQLVGLLADVPLTP